MNLRSPSDQAGNLMIQSDERLSPVGRLGPCSARYGREAADSSVICPTAKSSQRRPRSAVSCAEVQCPSWHLWFRQQSLDHQGTLGRDICQKREDQIVSGAQFFTSIDLLWPQVEVPGLFLWEWNERVRKHSPTPSKATISAETNDLHQRHDAIAQRCSDHATCADDERYTAISRTQVDHASHVSVSRKRALLSKSLPKRANKILQHE
jgi:hypothetical protein